MKLERYNENNFSDVCVWKDVFSDDEKIILQDGFVLAGLLSVILSLWLSGIIRFTSLRFDSNYRNLANFISVACMSRAVPLILNYFVFRRMETSNAFKTMSCDFFGFLETFLAVFEVECLTHFCIERYVHAKYVINGWPINQHHYNLYVCLCLMFSCAYSMPPLFGVGRYNFDFHCMSCNYDVIMPTTWLRYLVMAIYILRSIKSIIFMSLMLIWASVLESKFPCSMRHHQQFTRSVITITIVNLLCWTPIAMIRGSVLISQWMFTSILLMPTGNDVTWAMWIHWLAPAFTVIALFVVDDRVRYKLFNLNASQREKDGSEIKKD